MARKSDFNEILAGMFSLLIFFLIVIIVLKDLSDQTGLAAVISLIFVFGAMMMVFALLGKLFDLLSK